MSLPLLNLFKAEDCLRQLSSELRAQQALVASLGNEQEICNKFISASLRTFARLEAQRNRILAELQGQSDSPQG